MTITIGLWAVPLAITIAAFGWVFLAGSRSPQTPGTAIVWMFFLLCAGIVSLLAWLAWAIFR